MQVKVSILGSFDLTLEQYEGFKKQAGIQSQGDITFGMQLVYTAALQRTPLNIQIQPFNTGDAESTNAIKKAASIKPVKKGAKR